MAIFSTDHSRRLLVLATLLASSSAAFGQNSDKTDERQELQDAYKKQKQTKTSIFGTAPNHHITPKQDTISFSMQADLVDVGIAPANSTIPETFTDLDDRVQMTGWSTFPLIAFSAKNFGLGFTGEAGNRQVKFLSREKDSDEDLGSYFEQYSAMRYSGAGMYAFAVLRGGFLPEWLAGTFIFGGRSLTAIHESRGTRTDSTTIPEATKLKYDVQVFDAGLNIAATLAKRFTVFPWVNYRKTQMGAIKDRNENVSSDLSADDARAIEMDRDVMWTSEPNLKYGIDFAILIQNFELHFGGLFGYLANMNRGADRVQDESLSLSISYDFKSK